MVLFSIHLHVFCLSLIFATHYGIYHFSGANAQNSTGKPGVSMPATNLNIGMDLWNASAAGVGAVQVRPYFSCV